MNAHKSAPAINLLKILLFYATVLTATYFARKLPNLLELLLGQVTDVQFPFNYNHGLVTAAVALLFYRYGGIRQQITLLGDRPVRSLLFPLVLLGCYTVYGISNHHGMNRHVWAFLFCSLALVYNIMEEYAWRGYLIDSLGRTNYVVKSIVSGVLWSFWHLLVFRSFDQYGGFWIFFALCIVFSFILSFAAERTKSVLVAASIHAFIVQINIVALVCIALFALLLLGWNKQLFRVSGKRKRF
ncbi:CPBP family intramembrane glutamic endopeptidase [Rurimicrobium arvi]|uniref:CAAX prenyl protease 2/Lysostaphin resistance protein A-like domain-containing protein n=1 Tax=Rurimicrobium arvi TaxID=2049916 RepID=A0ABP8MHF6_9BACT